VARMVQQIKAFSILLIKPEGKRLVGIPRHRWQYNSEMYVK
jgi:hypothetical protein